ncbi:uncharacterized protein LOC132798171 [Drosophila nasuta]|uniref:uncharacterized protein LOC132798171 n=1 Tax=Drosophila nasuta TaxID=42062 RepID=UPI00295F01BE|nr:uncharacterized protein LOC132798171 [Drosophila nasuta]
MANREEHVPGKEMTSDGQQLDGAAPQDPIGPANGLHEAVNVQAAVAGFERNGAANIGRSSSSYGISTSSSSSTPIQHKPANTQMYFDSSGYGTVVNKLHMDSSRGGLTMPYQANTAAAMGGIINGLPQPGSMGLPSNLQQPNDMHAANSLARVGL